MKKFLVVCLSLLCLMFTFGLTACGDKTETLDLADCELGYELPVYPTCEFDYKVNDECTVHITKFSVTLIEKAEIKSNQVLETPVIPYLVNINVNGVTSPDNYGKTLTLRLQYTESNIMNLTATVDEEGKLYWYQAEKMISVRCFYFISINLQF